MNNFSTKSISTSAKCSNDTSMEGIKSLVTWRNEFEKRHMTVLLTFSLHISDCQDCDSKLKLCDFAKISDMKSVKFKKQTLVQGTKFVPRFKDEFEDGDELIQTASSGILGVSESSTREQIDIIFLKILLYKFSAVD